jgi:catechol 2,3-dioxygenase-like lactoylglutathione lyase family enzyme
MLRDMDATAMLPVRDIRVARDFYEGKLGLEPVGEDQDGMIRYRSGDSTIFAYESQYAGTNQGNALAWSVGDEFDKIFEDLDAHGVSFEHYDLPGLTLEGDVHVGDGFKAIWFEDPDGNILHINSGSA